MSNLIDCMVAVGVLALGAAILIEQHQHYETANRRAVGVESASRALDQEMEHFRSCADRACIQTLARKAPEEHADEELSWSRGDVERIVEAGPNGTIKITLIASVPGSRAEQKLVALLWVPK